MSNFEDDERFDGLYMNVAQQTRGIEPLLDTVFSFLRRKTDFFSGPPGNENGTAAAVAKVNEVLTKHVRKFEADKVKAAARKPKISPKPPTTSTEQKQGVPPEESQDDVIEMGKDGGFDVSKQPPKVPVDAQAPTKADKPKEVAKEEKQEEGEGSDEAPPLGNGGTVPDKYVWTQILSEVSINIPLPENTRGRDLNVSIARKHLKVGLKSQPNMWIVDDDLTKSIVCDDSFWTVEDGNRLVINLQKLNQMEWWDSVCISDPKIDIRKIQPENSNLSDLDGETRKTVEKMMHDQRQKALGLPSSEEESKLAALERFKKQHPNLDFSNAKIS